MASHNAAPLATGLAGTGTTTDPYVMTLTSPNTMGSGFTVSADTNTTATTITQGDTLTIAGGTNVGTVSNPDGTITINATDTNTTYDLSSGTDTVLNLYNSPVVATAQAASSSGSNTTILYDNESPVGGIVNGQYVTGAGIPTGTRVVSHSALGITFNQLVNVLNNAVISFRDVDTVAFTAGSNVTLTGTSNSIAIAATNDNTQNEYANSWVQSTNDILLRLTESGAGSGTQDIKIVKGANITFTYTDADNFTIAATDTTYDVMGAGNSYAAGLVLAGNATAGGAFLRKDGTWQVPPGDGNTTYSIDVPAATTNINLKGSSPTSNDAIALTPSTGISITRNNASQLTFANTLLPAILTDGANPGAISLYSNVDAADVRSAISAGTGDGVVESITTTGTSGAATLSAAGVLNIPNYAVGNDNDYLTGLAFNTTTGVLTATVQNQSNVTVDLDGRYLQTADNYYLDGITKSGNTLTFSVSGTTNQTYTFGSNAFNSTTIPTNNNQLTNGAGYITSYTETDTLATVTGRGATTGVACSFTNQTSFLVGGSGTGSIYLGRIISASAAGNGLRFHTNNINAYVDTKLANIYFRDYADNAGSVYTRFTMNTSTGTFTATGDVVAYSDQRLKTDIKTLDGSKVYKMRGVEFIKDGKQSSGVIAQELEKIAPELVNSDSEYKSVAYGNISGYLIEAIKELKQEIEELKSKSCNCNCK